MVKEAEKICKKLNIESVHTTTLKKHKYRKILLKACHKENEENLRSKANGKTKCEHIQNEEYGKKNYVDSKQIQYVRKAFRTRFGMNNFAGNYSHDRRFARTDWLCRCRQAKETESHILSGECEVYGDIRNEFENLDDLDTLVDFFGKILKKRDLLDAEESQN